jgi:anti-sigma B factor antagonist
MLTQLPPLQPTVQHDSGTTIITLPHSEEWQGDNPIARESLAAFAGELAQRRLLIDFSHVRRLTSDELATLIGLHKRLAGGGGRLILTHVQPQVYELFERTKLHRLLEIHRGEA